MYDLEDFVIVEDKLYYSCSKYNGLFYKDLITDIVKFVGFFPNEEIDAQRLHARIVYVDGRIICVPYCAYNIGIYDINNNQFESIGINKDGNKKYWGVEVYEHYVYMFPVFGTDVLCLDLNTNCVKIIEEYKKVITRNYENGECSFFGTCCFHYKLYAPVYKSRILTEYDLITKEFAFLQIPGDKDIVYSNIACDENGIYMVCFNKKQILFWNPATDAKRFFSYEEYLKTEDAGSGIIATLGVYDKNLYLHPFNSRQRINISLDGAKNAEVSETNYNMDTIEMYLKNNYLYMIQHQKVTLLHIEELNSGRCDVLTIDSSADDERIKAIIHLGYVMYESEKVSLKKYVELL